MNKQTIAIIILSIIIAGLLLFYGYNYTLNKGYQLGRGDLILDMNINLYFPLICVYENNITTQKRVNLESLNLREICNG